MGRQNVGLANPSERFLMNYFFHSLSTYQHVLSLLQTHKIWKTEWFSTEKKNNYFLLIATKEIEVQILSNLKSKYTATDFESIIYQHCFKYFTMKADTLQSTSANPTMAEGFFTR